MSGGMFTESAEPAPATVGQLHVGQIRNTRFHDDTQFLFVEDGKVTEQGLAQLRESMPHADIDKFAQNPEVGAIPDLFTVDMICKYVGTRLA